MLCDLYRSQLLLWIWICQRVESTFWILKLHGLYLSHCRPLFCFRRIKPLQFSFVVFSIHHDSYSYFDHALANYIPNYIRLLSASIYNSWYNLKESGRITIYDNKKNPCSHIFLPGFYTLENVSYALENAYKEAFGITIPTHINQPTGAMVIYNTTGNKILLDEHLANFLGYDKELKFISFIKGLNSLRTYFIHCDLVDKDQNLLNGKALTVLARFDIHGKPFERVNYQTTQQHVLRDASSCNFANSITLSVRDENNNLFDFKGMPLAFEVEKN